MAFSTELVAFFVAAITWVLWRLNRNFILSSPLDNIPGPAPVSWVKGLLQYNHLFVSDSHPVVVGNLGQLYDRHAWEWLDGLGNNFNKVVRLTGLFGVSSPFRACLCNLILIVDKISTAYYTFLIH